MAERNGAQLGCMIGAGIGAGIAAFFFFGFIFLLILIGSFGSSESGTVSQDHIARIDVEGMITSAGDMGWAGTGVSMVERVAADLKKAVDNKAAKAIVIRINSPGGEVTASDVLYHHVKKASKKKPVIVYMDSMAASGGYYIACGAKEIYANETTLTGSIGVIISTINYNQLFEKLGLESMVFTSGKFKDSMSGGRPMREDEKELVQGLVDDIYERFLKVVKEARPQIPDAQLRADIADGRIFTGANAKNKKLVDEIGYIDDTYDRARELGKAPKAEVIRYHQAVSLFDAIGMSARARAQNPGNEVEVQLPGTTGARLQPGMVYLLPSFFAN